jgi:DNA polymerase-1
MIEFAIRSPHHVPCRLIQDEHDFAIFDDWITRQRSEVLGLDTETNAVNPWSPGFELRLIQISDGKVAWLMEPGPIARALISEHPQFVAHFSEAEVRYLGRGLPGALRLGGAEPHVLDYQVIQAIIDPRSLLPRKDGVDIRLLHDKGLKETYEREVSPCLREARDALYAWFKTNAPKGHKAAKASTSWGFAHVPLTEPAYLEYSAMDAVCVKVLYEMGMEVLRRPENATELAEAQREFVLQWDCDNMTFRGVPVDPPYVRWLANELDQVVEKNAGFLARYGIAPSGQGAAVGQAFTDLNQLPVKMNPARDGKPETPSWDKDALAILEQSPNEDVRRLARALLDVRRAGKFRVTYVQPMIDALARDCRIHCSFRSIGTVTHRNSAANPPLQQQPKKDQRVRAAFGGVPGWVWVTCDLEQGEPRGMAGLSGDPAFVQAVNTGDVNNAIALDVNGQAFVPAEGKTAGTASYLMRQLAKMGLLAICYGVGLKKLASQFGITIDEAAAFRNRVRSLYRVMFSRGDRMNQQETVRLPSGRQIILWDRKMVMPDGAIITSSKPSRKALNYETQGWQADYLKACWLRLRVKWGWALTFFLHDEIALFVPESMAAEAAADLKREMTRPIGNGVMMTADAEVVGPTWLPQPKTFDRTELESVDAA